MGRLTQAARASFYDHLNVMRTEYKEALVSKGRREAFDMLVEAWSSELGAISYAESLSLMDLILLTGEVDNRASLDALRLKLDNLDVRLNVASTGEAMKLCNISDYTVIARAIPHVDRVPIERIYGIGKRYSKAVRGIGVETVDAVVRARETTPSMLVMWCGGGT